MEAYADAVVGLIGQGLSVEQRKVRARSILKSQVPIFPQRLTIGVELAAKVRVLADLIM
jgi:hypothetical protein